MMKILLACGFSLLGAYTSANAQAPIYFTQSQCAAIFQAAGDSYAGMWLAEDGQFVLSLTSEVNFDDAILKKLRIARVKYSEAKLHRFHNEVVKRTLSSLYISNTYVDHKANKVIAIVLKEQFFEAMKIFKANDIDLTMIQSRVQASTFTALPFIDDGRCQND